MTLENFLRRAGNRDKILELEKLRANKGWRVSFWFKANWYEVKGYDLQTSLEKIIKKIHNDRKNF